MRFISVCTVNPTSRLPTEAEIASMQKFIAESMKAGWLLECEGVTFGTTGVRVHKAASGEVTVTDSSLAETKEREILFSLFLRLCIEKVVHHRDDDVHALHQRDVRRLRQYGQSRF